MRILTLVALVLAANAAEPACRAESGERTLPLVELYTSEGCDSCPHADRWISQHFPPGRAPAAAVLAFHVDYWDRLGWKDRFASPAYTERQYQTMRANRATFVYTPQIVLQGRDFTGWRRGKPDHALVTASSRPSRARIELDVIRDASAIRVNVAVRVPDEPRRETKLAIAYADSRLVSAVKAGENRGATLTHDHVVRQFETRSLTTAHETFSVTLKPPQEAGSQATVVAFVQEVATGEVLQSVALPLAVCR